MNALDGLKLGLAAKGVPPELTEEVVGLWKDLRDLIDISIERAKSAVEKNEIESMVGRLRVYEGLKAAGLLAEAEFTLAEIKEDMNEDPDEEPEEEPEKPPAAA